MEQQCRNINNWLRGIVLTVLIPGLALTVNAQKSSKQPNILFILVDDLGYGDVGIFNQNARKAKGQPYLVTPSLDKMAANGATMMQQYVNAPVCAPSRSSFLSGVTQGHSNVRNNQFDKALEDNHTMASTLKAAGYTTVAIGKWGLQGLSEPWEAHPLKRGFDSYFGYIRHADGHEHYPKEGLYRKSKEVYDNTTNITPLLDKCYTGDLWTAKAKHWIAEKVKTNRDQPFFMYLAYDTPHATIELPTQEYPEGSGLNGGLQWLGIPGKMINTASGDIDSWMHPLFKNAMYTDASTGERKPWKNVHKRYATMVQRLDQEIGDLLQLLKDLHIDEHTIVVFASDNGPSAESYLAENYTPQFFDGYGPFDGIKRDTWEGGLRTPTIIQWPGTIPAGRKVHQPSMLSDWLPTFLQAAGVASPARMDGVSLLPALTGTGKQQQGLVYIEYYENGRTPNYQEFEPTRTNKVRNQMQTIRSGNFVGVRYDIKGSDDDFEIYNVMKDPKQSSNLAAYMPGLQSELKARALQARIPDMSAPRPYDTAMIPALTRKPAKPNQLQYKLFKGNFPWVPSTYNLKPLKEGFATTIDKNIFLQHKDATVIQYKGFINVRKDGPYTFYLRCNGNAFLRIHDAAAIDADKGYQSGTELSRTMNLKAGLHPFTLTYKNQPVKANIEFSWSGNNFEKTAFKCND